MNWKKVNRQIHYWGSVIIIIPVIIVIGSGLLLQVKKQFPWVQFSGRNFPVATFGVAILFGVNFP